ncbi:MAG: hypothetical protein ACREPV_04725 [Lysobacter sp.]
MNSYTQAHIDGCRERMTAQVAAYQALAESKSKGASARKPPGAWARFELHFFRNLLLALDHHFVHRARGKEGKDGNPLNEVRMLCNSIVDNAGVLRADTTIKYDPSSTVLKLCIGDEIALGADDYMRLMLAFLSGIERRYP